MSLSRRKSEANSAFLVSDFRRESNAVCCLQMWRNRLKRLAWALALC